MESIFPNQSGLLEPLLLLLAAVVVVAAAIPRKRRLTNIGASIDYYCHGIPYFALIL
jgi:hypothetical protein